MTLFSKNWTLASFSLTVLSSPYWPWMPPLGFALLCPLFLIVSYRYTYIRIGGGIVLAMLVIITHSDTVKTQSSSIFQAGQNITIKGKVDSFFKQISYGYEGNVSIQQVNGKTISTPFLPRIRLFSPISLKIGDEFEFVCNVKPVIGRLNETGFDIEAHYFSQGIVAKASINSNSRFQVTSEQNIRALIYDKVRRYTDSISNQGMVMALVFGERTGIDQQRWQQLRDSGLTHLIAISGLHIGIAFGLGYLFGLIIGRLNSKLLWMPFIMGALCAAGYAWLAGFSLPTQRALIMCLLNVFVVVIGIQISLIQRLLLTLAAVLFVDPFASLASSFWLSFIAVCLVLYLLQVTQSMSRWKRIICSQVMLVVLMAPVSVYFFGGVSWSSVLFNLVFIPWFSLIVVPTLFVSVLLSLVSIPITDVAWYLADWTFLPVNWAMEHAISGWVPISMSVQFLLLFAVLMWFLRGILNWYSLSLLTAIVTGWFWFKTPNHLWRMDVLDVGHGLAILFERHGQFLLYDTGSSWPEGSYVSSVIAPLIAKRGASSLDTVIYSHLDDDHAGGRHDIERLLSPRYIYASQKLDNSLACIRGQQWNWQGLEFSAVWPPKRVKRAYNQHSCVVRVVDREYGHSILLSGDVTAVGEWLLARGDMNLQSDIMIVPHHGSKTSSTNQFIRSINPSVAIASLAKGNRWNLPHRDVVQRYRQQDVQWLDTGDAGQIMLQFRAENRHLSTLRHDGVVPWYRQMLRKGVE